MAPKSVIEEALALSPQDRLELVERLWDSLQEELDSFPVAEGWADVLDRRAEEMESDPALGRRWEDVKAHHSPDQ
jgi:putative addiction module component (TIGR02574 family)